MTSATDPVASQADAAARVEPPAGRFGLDRFTAAIAIGATALVVVLFLIVLRQPTRGEPMDEARPAGVVHNYYLALLNDDPRKAYDYLSAEAKSKVSYEQFARQASTGRNNVRISIDEERIEDGTARVTVRRSSSGGGFFPFSSDEYTTQQTVVLRQEDGAWKLAPGQPFGLPYNFY